MKNAEHKAKDLIKRTIESAEAGAYMPGVIEELLAVVDPEDLVELGYAKYLEEYLREREGNYSDEEEAAIREALKQA